MSITGVSDDDEKWHALMKKAPRSLLDRLLRNYAELGDIEKMQALSAHGAGVAGAEPDALCSAVQGGHPAAVFWLLEHGVDAEIHGGQALTDAALCGNTDMVRILLDAGANPRANDNNPVYFAATMGHAQTLSLLVERGADIHCIDGALAAVTLMRGHREETMILLQAGANPTTRLGGCNMSEMAEEKGFHDLAAKIRDVLDDPPPQNLSPQGLLPDARTAAKTGAIRTYLERLQSAGKPPDMDDFGGPFPNALHILARRGELDLVFAPALWQNDCEKMLAFHADMPKGLQAKTDISRQMAAARRLHLNAATPKGKYSL